ncbi:hypothetical protein ACFYZ2_38850 [Streptomyces sviceus]|uniref:hypothetical protein n=1 Tax=Streptomyces sviceus TaxID=285530 RepID=UPI00368E213C
MTVTRRTLLLASTAAGVLPATPVPRAAESAGRRSGRRMVALRDGRRFALVDPGGIADTGGAVSGRRRPRLRRLGVA